MCIRDRIKAKVQIADLVGKSFTVAGKGRVLTTKEHDSLKLWPETGRWWWFSQDIGGDIIDWYRHVHRCDLGSALDALAALAVPYAEAKAVVWSGRLGSGARSRTGYRLLSPRPAAHLDIRNVAMTVAKGKSVASYRLIRDLGSRSFLPMLRRGE